MKRCPECRRDYLDDSLMFCLEDGVALIQGSVSLPDEPPTAILGNADRFPGATTILHALKTKPEPDAGQDRAPRKPSFFTSTAAKVPTILVVLIVILYAAFSGYRYLSAPKQIGSIAVMPFVNESGNADVEYLSDGLTETLIGSLSKLGDLSVKSRNAVFAYKGRDISAKDIGSALGVQAVLLGRLVQRGENIKLNLELVNATTQDVIWADQYDRKQADLVNLQSEIARDVSSKLKSKLSGSDQRTLDKKYTDDPEAYRLYLQGRFYLNKRVGKEYEKAEGYLRQAVDRDPNFALGYTGLAEFIGPRDRTKAKEYIIRALAIDDQLSDAHALLGLQYSMDRDWNMSEREFKKALELDPDNGRALHWYSSRLLMTGRYDDCLRTVDRAVAIEPTQADIRNNRGECLVAAGQIDEGIESIKDTIKVDPGYPWSFSHLSFVYRMKGDRAASVDARAHAEELLEHPDRAQRLRAAFTSGWTAYLRELLAQTNDNFQSPTRRASILAELGQKEDALASLEESAAKGDWWLFSIKYDPAFDPLRGEPRFQAILKQFEPPK